MKLSAKLLCVLLDHLTELQFPLKKSFTKTVLVEFAKGYLESHGGPWWKRKHLPLNTRKKLSQNLLCVLLIHLTELQHCPPEAFCYDCSCGICKGIFGSRCRAMVKNEISWDKNWKEAFWETALYSENSTHRVTALQSRSLSLRLLLCKLQSDIWKPLESNGEKGNNFS